MRRFPAALLALAIAAGQTAKDYKLNHSHLGKAFDEVPGQKPWIIARMVSRTCLSRPQMELHK